MDDASTSLGEYLRARRAVTQPEDVGIVPTPGRRVTGLRRDEVAALAGISREYYLRLEQGRGARPSDQVLLSLCRALRLDHEATAYAFRLVSGRLLTPAPVPRDSADRIVRALSAWTHTPAYVTDPHRDIVAANPLATVFGHGGLSAGGNQLRHLFVPRMKETLVEWEAMSRAAVATLRRDAVPQSPRLREIVAELSSDPDFVRIWARHDVSGPEDATFHILVEGVGEIPVDAQNFAVRSMPGYQLTVLSAPPGAVTAAVFARLADQLPGGIGADAVEAAR